MVDSLNEKDENEIESYLECHGLAKGSDYYKYHMSLGFYYIYYIDALQYADMIDGGEVFDEYEVSAVLDNLYIAYKTYLYYKSQLGLEIPDFDLNETVNLTDSKIEQGMIVGNKDNAVKTAKKWLQRFVKRSDIQIKEGLSENAKRIVSQDLFLYEVAIFILYIAGEEVNYDFLFKR